MKRRAFITLLGGAARVAAHGSRAADGSDASERVLWAAAVGDTAEQTPEGIKLTSRVQHGVFWPRCIFWTTSEV
jgi:hypothetical protein